MKNERGTWRLTLKRQLCKQCGTGKTKYRYRDQRNKRERPE